LVRVLPIPASISATVGRLPFRCFGGTHEPGPPFGAAGRICYIAQCIIYGEVTGNNLTGTHLVGDNRHQRTEAAQEQANHQNRQDCVNLAPLQIRRQAREQ